MTQYLTRSLTVLALLACLTTLTGCLAAAAAGAAGAGVAYAKGDLEATVEAAPPAVADAAVQAMEDLGLNVTAREVTAIGGTVRGVTPTDKDVRIEIERISDNASNVSIRVGAFGNEELSRTIYDRMRRYLR